MAAPITFRRFEFKYVLEPHIARAVESYIRHIGFTLDPQAARGDGGSYIVTSLYFDSPYFSDYYEKVDGLLERKKVRARMYPDASGLSENVWLEVKYKYDMFVTKNRLRLGTPMWRSFRDSLVRGGAFVLPHGSFDNSPENVSVAEDIKYRVVFGAMRPHVVVRYRRRPYRGVFESPLRITFDTDIQACRSTHLHSHPTAVPFETRTVMEVKFAGNLPSWFGALVRQFGLKRQKYSKYAESVNAVYGRELFVL